MLILNYRTSVRTIAYLSLIPYVVTYTTNRVPEVTFPTNDVPEVIYSTNGVPDVPDLKRGIISSSLITTKTSTSPGLNTRRESNTIRLSLTRRRAISHFKYIKSYNKLLNYGRRKVKRDIQLKNLFKNSKVNTRGNILKVQVQKLREVSE